MHERHALLRCGLGTIVSRLGGHALGVIVLLTFAMTVHGQQPPKVMRIGWPSAGAPLSHGTYVAAFRDALRAAGRVEGRDVVRSWRARTGWSRRREIMARADRVVE